MAERRSNPKRRRTWAVVLALIILMVLVLSIQFRTNGRITSSGRTRKYLVYVPESYDPDLAAPLVISIHGFVQWPAHQQSMTGWNKLADEHGFLVVYPRGTGFPLRWNTQPGTEGKVSMEEELQFFSDLIDHLESTYHIDPGRIYVNGMSNGGGMTDLLACELSERIAAVGGVAGAYLYPRDACNPSRPVPVIAFHGQEDQIVPYLGGTSSRDFQFSFPPVEEWAASWAGKNACDGTPASTKITENVTRWDYADCAENARVIFYSVYGAGHTWPGGEKLPVWITGPTNQEINASELMWEFYQGYSLDR